MNVKMIPLECSACGANIELDAEREFGFCPYCGTKILISNNNTYTYRKVDEADVIRATNEKEIHLEELKSKSINKTFTQLAILTIVALIALMVLSCNRGF